jgi:hypothetical protein
VRGGRHKGIRHNFRFPSIRKRAETERGITERVIKERSIWNILHICIAVTFACRSNTWLLSQEHLKPEVLDFAYTRTLFTSPHSIAERMIASSAASRIDYKKTDFDLRSLHALPPIRANTYPPKPTITIRKRNRLQPTNLNDFRARDTSHHLLALLAGCLVSQSVA